MVGVAIMAKLRLCWRWKSGGDVIIIFLCYHYSFVGDLMQWGISYMNRFKIKVHFILVGLEAAESSVDSR